MYRSVRHAIEVVMIVFTIDVVLILFMGIGIVVWVNSAIIVLIATAINYATVTLLRQYLLNYTRYIVTCVPIDFILRNLILFILPLKLVIWNLNENVI